MPSFHQSDSAGKGIIYLFVATIAEVVPVVRPARSLHTLLFSSSFYVLGVHLFKSER